MERCYPGGRPFVRINCEKKGIPVEAQEILLQSISDSSWKQYDSGWRKWWSFCIDLSLDPFEPEIQSVLRFLAKEFNSGASYGTLNSYRSALSMIAGSWLAQEDALRRFFKGIYRARPGKPKYDYTWDPKIILDHYRQSPENSGLSIKDLSFKVIILLALVTGHRMQTFSLITIENIRQSEDCLEIKVPQPIKTSRKGHPQPLLIIPFYKNESKLCVASTIQEYLQRTQEIRGNVKELFISYKKPYRRVSSQTLSHWIKNVLKNCKIDTTVFSAYSTRHAATSAANRNGLSIDVIKKSAGWSEKSQTFARFYNLPLIEKKNAFADAVFKD